MFDFAPCAEVASGPRGEGIEAPTEILLIVRPTALIVPNPFFLRSVTKALGSTGYDKIRLSVISHDATPPSSSDAEFSYSSEFKYRWKAAYDMGTSSKSCSQAPISSSASSSDGDCLLLCTETTDCNFYVFDSSSTTCSIFGECDYANASDTTFTYSKFGTNYLHSSIITVTPGEVSSLEIANTTVSVSVPAEDGPTSGIVWSDPCISGRWVGCERSDIAHNHSVDLLITLAADNSWHFFQVLGDNFYDQDRKLTKYASLTP